MEDDPSLVYADPPLLSVYLGLNDPKAGKRVLAIKYVRAHKHNTATKQT